MSRTLVSPVAGVVFNRGHELKAGPLHKTRWAVFGGVGSGKTSFGCSIPDAFYFDYEGKVEYVPQRAQKFVTCCTPTTLEENDKVADWLCSEKRRLKDDFPIKIVVIDTMDELLHGLVIPDLTKALMDDDDRKLGRDVTDYGSGGGGSKGWSMCTNRCLSMLSKFRSAGLGWVVLGHLREQKKTIRENGNTVEITGYRPAVNPGVYGGLYRQKVFLCHTGWTDVSVKGEPRTIKTKEDKTITIPGKATVERKAILSIRNSSSGDDVQIGSNVSLPPMLVVPEVGDAWNPVISKAYTEALEKLNP